MAETEKRQRLAKTVLPQKLEGALNVSLSDMAMKIEFKGVGDIEAKLSEFPAEIINVAAALQICSWISSAGGAEKNPATRFSLSEGKLDDLKAGKIVLRGSGESSSEPQGLAVRAYVLLVQRKLKDKAPDEETIRAKFFAQFDTPAKQRAVLSNPDMAKIANELRAEKKDAVKTDDLLAEFA